ncbi:MOSC domain-containing protein [Paenibacillus sp. HB172176]|uniref:MOSC domain-containing protein n=1 Tax=Paenibacillus sp. HB172176 TaxID=2493690 RepID=UPI00143B9580|nr:MOSC domain-containing protein [Paenibacillus sp. HB172176]
MNVNRTRPIISSVQVGEPVLIDHGNKQVLSGIWKRPSDHPIYASRLGMEGDAQADTVNHGGEDKAICAYFGSRYSYWEAEYGRPFPNGSFGENITISDWTEEEICIGDVIAGDEVVLQVSQPRQPCFKLGLRHSLAELPVRVRETGYSGFYFRVIQEGNIRSGEPLKVVQKHSAGCSIMQANQVMYVHTGDRVKIEQLLTVEPLSESWKKQLQSRLNKL